jgi:Protein of unknown function (DUF1571)
MGKGKQTSLARLSPVAYLDPGGTFPARPAMRTYLSPAILLVLLVICLMFAPVRRVTGDHELSGRQFTVPPAASATPIAKSFADLCRDDPLEAIAESMRRYKASVESYTCTLIKRERINGESRPQESIACDFQEAPFAVIMRWTAGKSRADAMLYAAGENGDQLLIVPSSETLKGALRVMGKTYGKRALTSEDAKSAARYPANKFGIYHGTARVYDAWKAADEAGALKTRYEGVRPIPELGSRPCHVLHRDCLAPEEDGFTVVICLFDAETLLQTGAILRIGDELFASYYFSELKVNPKFELDHFAAKGFR